MKTNFFLLLIFGLLLFALQACGDEPDDVPDERPADPQLTAFRFKKEHNPSLRQDISCRISDTVITAHIPELTSAEALIPAFEGTFHHVEVDHRIQYSGQTPQNFHLPVHYQVVTPEGHRRTYQVVIQLYSGLPILQIQTQNSESVTSKENYLPAVLTIHPTPEFPAAYHGPVQIRGRGNATWISYPKKPYRLKLGQAAELFGMTSDKDWALLAEYCDKSMLRTTCAFELSRLMGLPWTPGYQPVDLFLNGRYDGTYLLCEHIKAAPHRAPIAPDGYLIENDNYWHQEPLYFTTRQTGTHFTFKHPDPDDLSPTDPDFLYIRDYMDALEATLFSPHFQDPDRGYPRYIDARNFAQWFLLQEVLGNIDTNPYYALESRTSKLKMYPVWDFEWSLGLAATTPAGWATPQQVPLSPVDKYYHRNPYFTQLLRDPAFVQLLRQEWQTLKNAHLPALFRILAQKTQALEHAQKNNFNRWPILGQYISVGLTNYSTWEEEVNHALHFLNQRIAWLDNEIEHLHTAPAP
jgi:hypothetical protein